MVDQDVRQRFSAACSDFLKSEHDLLAVDATERALVHKLAEAMQRHFHDWHVDVEYNRNEAARGDDVERQRDERRMSVLEEFREAVERARGLSDPHDLDAITAHPDIIVHRRRHRDNLLVVEVQRAGNGNALAKGFDLAKLQMYQQEDLLGYSYAAMVTLRLGHAEVEWWDGVDVKGIEIRTEHFDIRI